MMQPEVRCVEFVEDVTEWMDGALDDDRRVLVEEHLAICPDCTAYLDQLRLALRLAEDAPVEAPPPAAREALLAEFRRRRRAI